MWAAFCMLRLISLAASILDKRNQCIITLCRCLITYDITPRHIKIQVCPIPNIEYCVFILIKWRSKKIRKTITSPYRQHCADWCVTRMYIMTIVWVPYIQKSITYRKEISNSNFTLHAQFWTNVDLSSPRFGDVHLRAISLEISQPSITKISLKIIFLRFYWNLPGANELRCVSVSGGYPILYQTQDFLHVSRNSLYYIPALCAATQGLVHVTGRGICLEWKCWQDHTELNGYHRYKPGCKLIVDNGSHRISIW